MPRGLSATQKAALAQRVRGVAYFVELSLATPVRAWTGVGSITALGATWIGVGELGVIDGVQSDLALKAQEVSLALTGLPTDVATPGVLQATRAEFYQGKPLKIYYAMTNIDTGALLDAPVPVWVGVADVLAFQRGDTVTCTLTGEHISSRLRQSNGLRMTTQNHNARFGRSPPTDLFFEPQTRLAGVAKAAVA